MVPASADFEQAIQDKFDEAALALAAYVDINSGELHRYLGGYPGRSHKMPNCCSVMRRFMGTRDKVLREPPKGNGASLTIRYALPRPSAVRPGGPEKTVDLYTPKSPPSLPATSNVERGRQFQRRALELLQSSFNLDFEDEIGLDIGNSPKRHRFDLASRDRLCVGECKDFSYTKYGNIPSAKITTLKEAASYLLGLPQGTRRFIIMRRDLRIGFSESLAEYFVRLHSSALGDVSILEIQDDDRIKFVRIGSFRPLAE